MLIRLKNKDKLIIDDFKLKCCIGKNGVKKQKIEGDNSTPKGTFTIGTFYYRKDRVIKPFTNLKQKLSNQTLVGAMIQNKNLIIKKLKLKIKFVVKNYLGKIISMII